MSRDFFKVSSILQAAKSAAAEASWWVDESIIVLDNSKASTDFDHLPQSCILHLSDVSGTCDSKPLPC